MGGVSRTCLPLNFQADGRQIAGETLFAESGASVFVLTSCTAELGLELRSAYLDGAGGEILVGESAVLTNSVELHSRRLEDADEALLIYQRRRLLYDHLQTLQDLAIRIGVALSFEGIDTAAVVLDPHLPSASRS